jgi:peptidoglycan/xylan/chitin deacetylase (PgdA/CDA1 family)
MHTEELLIHDVVQRVDRARGIAAARIDFPRELLRVEGRALEVVGWAVGLSERVESIELTEGLRVLSRALMAPGREDVARLHEGSPQGDAVSFHAKVPRLSAGAHDIAVRARLEGGGEALLGTIRLEAFRRRRAKGTLVLMYHRVAALPSEPWSLSVSPAHFAEQMDALERRATPISLRRLSSALRGGAVPDRSVVVTFDDGYADNYLNALPVLERHAIPATVFLATGFVGGDREFWWDRLDRILLSPGSLPPLLRVRAEGKLHEWDLGADAEYTDAAAHMHREWRAGAPPPTRRHAAYRELWDLMSRLSPKERDTVVEQLDEWCGLAPEARATHRALTWDETAALARSPLVEIGAHTVTHPALSALPRNAQRLEIVEGKKRLEGALGRRVTSFAYPFGTKAHYTEETVALVADAGLESACSNFAALVGGETDPRQLPRTIVPDVDGEGFTDFVTRWLDD